MLQTPTAQKDCIWVHACSVGEVGSVAPLIRQLIDRGFVIHLTVVTVTGFAHAKRLLGEHISISYLPWDLPTAFSRFVRILRPALLLLVETEFWPGMLAACHKASVPIVGINTRISDRSFPRYQASRFLWKRFLKPVSLFLAQSKTDAERLTVMGIDAEKIDIAGNLKYAVTAPDVDASTLRAEIEPDGSRPILLIASSHEGEEKEILDMWPTWHASCPNLLTVIVPRHPQRFEQVAETIRNRGLKLARWSELQGNSPTDTDTDVILIDAMGVLGKLYTIADAVVIAGSLTNIGGHNPLEAAICGRGVVTGPHIQNFRGIMCEMQREHGAIVANHHRELEEVIERLLTHPDELKELNASAALFIRDRKDVLERIMTKIEPWLPKVPSHHE